MYQISKLFGAAIIAASIALPSAMPVSAMKIWPDDECRPRLPVVVDPVYPPEDSKPIEKEDSEPLEKEYPFIPDYMPICFDVCGCKPCNWF
jgi:hypothetical protein